MVSWGSVRGYRGHEVNDHPWFKVTFAWFLAIIPATLVEWAQLFAYLAAGLYSVYQFYRLWKKK